jgi:hypothetical protein
MIWILWFACESCDHAWYEYRRLTVTSTPENETSYCPFCELEVPEPIDYEPTSESELPEEGAR